MNREYGFVSVSCLVVTCIAFASALSIQDDEPITGFQISSPRNEEVTTLPVQFKFNVDASSAEAFNLRYGSMVVCVELESVSEQFSSILQLQMSFDDLQEGNYFARAYIYDGAVKYHEIGPVSFSILTASAFDNHIDELIKQSQANQQFPPDLSILQWAQLQQTDGNASSWNHSLSETSFVRGSSSDELQLVIGIKTAVLTNFPQRQAIRETWANNKSPSSNESIFSWMYPDLGRSVRRL
ncbi:unnamed protein product [Phytophthora lilii]|uniref:Unnamed protein product n=1 Tax=Phytophthora lilii TaxID=2077276 RepID=A0A9W6U799_9STRA|nr:unnamed protein product [Phytophthora lilii]